MSKHFDILVIGGGHAGCEAALAPARMGLRTAMVTLQAERIGYMPCNPAVGGLGKGHLVKELDALGAEIGTATDRAGIQFRMLNRAKGPAVWAPRAQVDKVLYSHIMRDIVENQENLTLIEAEVSAVVIEGSRCVGLQLADGSRVTAMKCIVTTGTFLRGLMHVGEEKRRGGREGEPETTTLSDSLRAHGFRMGRLKTGTPPRILRASVDLSCFDPQYGDERPTPFSHRTEKLTEPQENCYLTHTRVATHEVIRKHIDRAPMFRGDIEGIGTRYCPSIEDKVVRFPDKTRHQIFIEPEGRDHPELYLNGISTSMPVDVQLEILKSIPGLDTAVLCRPGYAVEYDFFFPDQLKRTMESKLIDDLYFAGQVNGTSGYEEAAAQGFIAGVNAAHTILEREPLVLGRDEAYIGVLIDDLTTKEIDEPYRMFTSRAEFRLLLRQDNADERLMATGVNLGLVREQTWEQVQARMSRVAGIVDELSRTNFPMAANESLVEEGIAPIEKPVTLHQALKRPEILFRHIRGLLDAPGDAEGVDIAVECAVKYSGYIERQARDIKAMQDMEGRPIPSDFPFDSISALSTEARQKLLAKRPETIGQAGRISGVRASDLSILVIHLERHRRGTGPAQRHARG